MCNLRSIVGIVVSIAAFQTVDPGSIPSQRSRPTFVTSSCGSASKESACNAGDPGSIPGLGRSPGEGNGNQLQYSCLTNPMDRGA